MTSYDEAARSFAALPADRCSWCSSPFHEIYRKGLCRHCYKIELDKCRLRKEVKNQWQKNTGTAWRKLDLPLRVDCYVATEMEEIERSAGELQELNREPAHSAMTIEELLEYISRRLLHKNLYNNCATTLSSLFSSDQRKALIHLLSEVVDEHQRRNLRKTVQAGPTVERSQKLPRWLISALSERG